MKQPSESLYFKTFGRNNGNVLVFLHGYLESTEIWDSFAEKLADEYFVVCIDLPGHGRSFTISENPSLEKFGDAIIAVLNKLSIKQFQVVGHSMGGYLSLSLLENYPDRLQSIVLFHSGCFADSDEKKHNREKEIKLIRKGKKELIFDLSIPRLYSNFNLVSFSAEIEKSKKIALHTNESGIIAALQAMKDRPDRSKILANATVPAMVIAGRNDNLIPVEIMEKMQGLSENIKLFFLENSGHMGFIEEPELAEKALRNFFEENFECT